MNTEVLKSPATDLRIAQPRSPHEKLGGYVIAARVVDKERARLLGMNGEHHYHPYGLAAFLWLFTGVKLGAFQDYTAIGADDDDCGRWLAKQPKVSDPKGNRSLEQPDAMPASLRPAGLLPDLLRGLYPQVLPAPAPGPLLVRRA